MKLSKTNQVKFSLIGDKSIAHRVIILAAISKNKHIIKNFPSNDDVLTTLNALSKFGLKYETKMGITHIDSTKINNHGLSLGSLELVPGGELPLHHHSPQEIYIIRKGKGLLLSKSERREVFPETSIYT